MIVNARPDYQTNRVAAEAVEEVIWVAPTAEAWKAKTKKDKYKKVRVKISMYWNCLRPTTHKV